MGGVHVEVPVTRRACRGDTGGGPARTWAGLGYNRRAIQLQHAARLIVERHAGRVPDDVDALENLPGIGPYTARAVAAVAYSQPVAAVDTNVRRVVTRVVGRTLGQRELQAAADRLLDADEPAAWTHAMMDLGADGLPTPGARVRRMPDRGMVRECRFERHAERLAGATACTGLAAHDSLAAGSHRGDAA